MCIRDRYMKELKNAGESSEIDKDVVESLYEDYWKTEKLVETLTGSVNLEVSDSEAKVITVDEIVPVSYTHLDVYKRQDTSYYNDMTGGIGYFKFLEDCAKNFDEKKSEIIAGLKRVMEEMCIRDRHRRRA